MSEKKPNVLIIGGCGFIGRNLVKYLVDNDLCSNIKVVDKVVKSVAFFSDEHKAAFEAPNVKYKQGNAGSKASLEKCWKLKNKDEDFDYVFNLASETKYELPPEVYEQNVLQIVQTIIDVARTRKNIKRIFDISTAQVYSPGKKPADEESKIKPWTVLAEYKHKAEQLWLDSKLPVVIVRPSIVYGPGDVFGIMPRLTIARVYQYLRKTMKLLWGGDLRVNTVHVYDVCRALWHLTTHGETGTIYNLSDKNDTNQKKLNTLIESIFGIKTKFFGSVICKFAKLNLKNVTAEVNDKHIKPWAELQRLNNLDASPISPYIPPELLYDIPLSVDGSKIESIGFEYKYPTMTSQLLVEMLNYWLKQNVFPKMEDGGNYDDESSSEEEEFDVPE